MNGPRFLLAILIISTSVGCATIRPNPPSLKNEDFKSRLPPPELYPASGSLYNDAVWCTGRLHGMVGRIKTDRVAGTVLAFGGSAITLAGGAVAVASSDNNNLKEWSLVFALAGGLLAAITPYIGNVDEDLRVYEKALNHFNSAMLLLDQSILIPKADAAGARSAEFLNILNKAALEFRNCAQ